MGGDAKKDTKHYIVDQPVSQRAWLELLLST